MGKNMGIDLSQFNKPGFKTDAEGLLRNLRREGTPQRVYHIELFQDQEIENEIDGRYGVSAHLTRDDRFYDLKRSIAMQRFLGYDYVCTTMLALPMSATLSAADSTRAGGQREWLNESQGIITNWEEFEKYPWPDGQTWKTADLEWYDKNLPDDMCLVGRGGHLCEYLCGLMGYETLCYALFEQRDLVEAIAQRTQELELAALKVLLQSDRVRIFWASDDMGFNTGLMLSPNDTRELVLRGHKSLAACAHQAGVLYLLHACGNRRDIIDNLLDDVRIDGLHSWEDKIELITSAKQEYGGRLSLLGGIDVDLLCRGDEQTIRRRVRETIAVCQPGGGFCLGSGNTVANYIPLDNYLVMLDEGRRWGL